MPDSISGEPSFRAPPACTFVAPALSTRRPWSSGQPSRTAGRMADGRRKLRRLACLLVLTLGASCAGEGSNGSGNGGGNGGNGTCEPPETPSVSFSQNIQPIYTQRCAYSGCHVAPAPAEGLDLAAGVSYDATVNVPSRQDSSLDLIRPGSLSGSYLWLKIDPPSGQGLVQMPLGCPGIPPAGGCLTAMELAAIQQWITECALNN